MALVGALTDVDVASAELDQPLNRFPLVVDGGGRQVEMETVGADLVLRTRDESDVEPGVVGR